MPDLAFQSPAPGALARWENEGGAREAIIASLPGPVVDLAERLGADLDTAAIRVSLTQIGDMQLGRGARRSRFRARQTIDLRSTGFVWRAWFEPFGAVSVCDAYREGAGSLDVRLFGLVRLAHMDGPAIAKGEIMRYLAELALAPDAILSNRSLSWSVLDRSTLSVAAGFGAGCGSVQINLDDEGRVGSIFAPDRPFADGEVIEERPWSGRFFDYRRHAGRWLPFGAEVGWTVNGQLANYWRGTMTHWAIA